MLKGLNSGEDDRILFFGVFLGDLTVYYWIIILMGILQEDLLGRLEIRLIIVYLT